MKNDQSPAIELGRSVLEHYLRDRKRFHKILLELRELEEALFSVPASHPHGERVMHGVVADRQENRTLQYLSMKEEAVRLQEQLRQQEEKIETVLSGLPEDTAGLLRTQFLEKKQELESETRQTGEQVEFTERCFTEFWEIYESTEGHRSPILEARICRIWKDYVQRVTQKGLLSPQEAQLRAEAALKMSSREINRKLRLLKLIPELQTKVVSGVLSEGAAYQISYLKKAYQHRLYEIMLHENTAPSLKQAQQLRKCSFDAWYHDGTVIELLRR